MSIAARVFRGSSPHQRVAKRRLSWLPAAHVGCEPAGISLYPAELYNTGMEIFTASTIRNHPAALSPRIKSMNYLNNIMAKVEGL